MPYAKRSSWQGLVSLALCGMFGAASACHGPEEREAAPDVLSYEQYKASALRVHQPAEGWVAEFDLFAQNEAQLRALYESYRADALTSAPSAETGRTTAGLTLRTISGVDNVWARHDRQTLTYCVDINFDDQIALQYAFYDRVRSAAAIAANYWSSVGDVRFVYRPDQDKNCTTANENVRFAIVFDTVGGSQGLSTWPNEPTTGGSIRISSSHFWPDASAPPYTTEFLLRHEMGHMLGFRHEHVRFPSSGCAQEGTDWRAITAPDPYSVMQAPNATCFATNSMDATLTEMDKVGARSVYGSSRLSSGTSIAADYNSDGSSDLAFLYDYEGDKTGLWVAYSNGMQLGAPQLIWTSPSTWYFESSQAVAADFDGDGYGDVGLFYAYADNSAVIYVFWGGVNGLASTPSLAWQSDPGQWNGFVSKVVAGNFNSDGYADIAVLYDYGNLSTGLLTIQSLGASRMFLHDAYSQWQSSPNSWSWSSTKVSSGDVDADGSDDVVLLYDYGNEQTGALVMYGDRSTGLLGHPTSAQWLTGQHAFGWARSRFMVAQMDDANGADLVFAYDYVGDDAGVLVVPSNPGRPANPTSQFGALYTQYRGSGLAVSRSQFVAGRFRAGRASADVVGLYDMFDFNMALVRIPSDQLNGRVEDAMVSGFDLARVRGF